ncbi:MAG TPA: OmpA family protein [Rhizomicrobium sp.]|jgi:outer membrane protein OmpA-like peptidoglycan-associated protein
MKKLIVPLAALVLAGCAAGPRYYPPPPEPMQPYPQHPANMHRYTGPKAAPTQHVQVSPYRQPPPPPVAPVASAGPLKTASVSAYMDDQEKDLRARMRAFGVIVARRGNAMVLTIRDSRLFGAGDEVSGEGAGILQALATIARRFDHTAIQVDSYTDTAGSPVKNMNISLRRATAVASTLESYGVARGRVAAKGFGEQNLRVATGENVKEPRNRRTEIHITPTPMG